MNNVISNFHLNQYCITGDYTAELEIPYQLATGHFPTNLHHLAELIQFATPNLLYIFHWEAIDSL